MLQYVTLGVIVIFSLLIPCVGVEILEKRKFKNTAESKMNSLTQAYAALMKPAKYMTATVSDDFLKGTVFEEMYANTEIEKSNKLSLNEDGKCYVATDVEAWSDVEYSEEPIKVLDGVCVKTKVNRYSDEAILVDVYSEYNKEIKKDELKIEVFKDGYLFGDEIITAEFKDRAQELDEKTGGMIVSIYYIGNVAYILLGGYKLTFSLDDLTDIQSAREYMEKHAQLLNDYIELANMLK